jgi:hypothetical protein
MYELYVLLVFLYDLDSVGLLVGSPVPVVGGRPILVVIRETWLVLNVQVIKIERDILGDFNSDLVNRELPRLFEHRRPAVAGAPL